jgi:hypothetical protein
MYAMLVTLIKAHNKVLSEKTNQMTLDAIVAQNTIEEAIKKTEAITPRLEQLEKRVASLSVSKGFRKDD